MRWWQAPAPRPTLAAPYAGAAPLRPGPVTGLPGLRDLLDLVAAARAAMARIDTADPRRPGVAPPAPRPGPRAGAATDVPPTTGTGGTGDTSNTSNPSNPSDTDDTDGTNVTGDDPEGPQDADTRVEGVDAEHQALVDRARAGDAEAFGEIYESYLTTVYHYLYYRTADKALAEDLASETFLRAWRRIDTFTWQGKDIGAWLVRIARNLLFDHVKSSRYRLEMTTADLYEPTPDEDRGTERAVLAKDAAGRLLEGIAQLSAEQQECLVLRFFEGLSVAETALVMRRNEGAIKALQHRAVRRLGSILPPDLAP